MAKLVVNSDSLVSVADAIREKGGTNASLEFPNGFVDGINAIESGGGEDTLRALLTNTLIEYTIVDEFTLNDTRLSASNLKRFSAPNLLSIGNFSLYGCRTLNYADLGRISSLNPSLLNGIHTVATVILRNANSVVALTGVFFNCNSILKDDYSVYCYFYVPKALIEDYKVATNWSNYANRFRAIEDYPEITGGVI